jgi:antirestriction protein ArdC
MSKVSDIVTKKILAELANGTVPWHKPWTTGAMTTGGQCNLISGKAYQGINQILTTISSDYNSPYWLTFKQAQKLGGSVIKGQESTMVIFYSMFDVTDPATELTRRVPALRYYKVFNTEQCENISHKRLDALGDPQAVVKVPTVSESAKAVNDALVSYFDRSGVTMKAGGNDAFYEPTRDLVQVPVAGAFESQEAFLHTLAHEAGHSTGHKSRLKRAGITGASSDSAKDRYAKEELVAEICAGMLLASKGCTPDIKNSASYIEGWLNKLSDDTGMIVSASSQASKATNLILDNA